MTHTHERDYDKALYVTGKMQRSHDAVCLYYAAPALLEALENVTEFAKQRLATASSREISHIQEAIAVIAQAKGETR